VRKFRQVEFIKTITNKHMSYFEEIDAWLSALFVGGEEDEDEEQWFSRVKREIKAKILESYRNGQKAGPPPEKLVRKEKSGPRPRFWPGRRRDGRQ